MEMQSSRPIGGHDRRLKLYHQHRHENHQVLKCPRCDSFNTKFCYYNNYNFSQPRHYCKSCRRYWTIGGILRNVPVGGGSRKSKNSKVKPPIVGTSTPIRDPELNSRALGDSSSLLADKATTVSTDALSALPSSSITNSLSVSEPQLFPASAISGLETANLTTQGSDFGISSEIGSFRSLVTNERRPFVFGYIHGMTPLTLNQVANYCERIQNQGTLELLQPVVEKTSGEDLRTQGIRPGFPEPTAETPAYNMSNSMRFRSSYWRSGENQGLLDIPSAVDQASWFKYGGLTTPFKN